MKPAMALYYEGDWFEQYFLRCTECEALLEEFVDGTIRHPTEDTVDYGFLWLKTRTIKSDCIHAGKTFKHPLAFELTEIDTLIDHQSTKGEV